MKIAEVIAKGNRYTPEEIEGLKTAAELFLEKLKAGRAERLAERSVLPAPPSAREYFFRSRERDEKTALLLKTMLAFLVRIPRSDPLTSKTFDPSEQFRECIRCEVDQLLQADVARAVFNEINRQGSPVGESVWDYKDRLTAKHRELTDLIDTAEGEFSCLFFTLCLAVEKLSLFWFDINGRELNRIRRSDITMYSLARILQGRYQQT